METKSSLSLASDASVNTLNMKAGGTVTGYGAIGTANISASRALTRLRAASLPPSTAKR